MHQLTFLRISVSLLFFAEISTLPAAELKTASADSVVLSNGNALTYIKGSSTQEDVAADFQLLIQSTGNCHGTTCTFRSADNSIFIVNSRPATKRLSVICYWHASDSRVSCDFQLNKELAEQLADANISVDPDSLYCTALKDATATFHWRDSNWKTGSGSADFRMDPNTGWILQIASVRHIESGIIGQLEDKQERY